MKYKNIIFLLNIGLFFDIKLIKTTLNHFLQLIYQLNNPSFIMYLLSIT